MNSVFFCLFCFVFFINCAHSNTRYRYRATIFYVLSQYAHSRKVGLIDFVREYIYIFIVQVGLIRDAIKNGYDCVKVISVKLKLICHEQFCARGIFSLHNHRYDRILPYDQTSFAQ